VVLAVERKNIDKWTWLLIYGGMLGASLGWFVRAGNGALGVSLMVGGAAVATVGVALVVLRSRLGP